MDRQVLNWLHWLGFESMWIVASCGGSGAEDCGGSTGLEFWVLWGFFFFLLAVIGA